MKAKVLVFWIEVSVATQMNYESAKAISKYSVQHRFDWTQTFAAGKSILMASTFGQAMIDSSLSTSKTLIKHKPFTF